MNNWWIDTEPPPKYQPFHPGPAYTMTPDGYKYLDKSNLKEYIALSEDVRNLKPHDIFVLGGKPLGFVVQIEYFNFPGSKNNKVIVQPNVF